MRSLALSVAIALLSFGALSCSTVKPVKNDRQGLFDRWAELEEVGGDDAPLARDDSDSNVNVKDLRGASRSWGLPLREVHVTSPFGKRGHDFHEGVDLRARSGTSVYAVDAGKVVYAGKRLRGYGKMIIIRHPSGLSSVYAHNSRLLVQPGQKIKRGQNIAISGASGHVSGPHLHFEVRKGDTPVDPQILLAGARRSFASN